MTTLDCCKHSDQIRSLRDRLDSAQKKINVLLKFEILLDTISRKYVLDPESKTAYNQLLLQYNQVFHLKDNPRQPNNVSSQTCSAPKTVTFRGKQLESYKVFDDITKKLTTHYREVKTPLIANRTDIDEETAKECVVTSKSVLLKSDKMTVNVKDNYLETVGNRKFVTLSMPTPPNTDSIDLTEDLTDRLNNNIANVVKTTNGSVVVLSVSTKSTPNVRQEISVKSLGRTQSVGQSVGQSVANQVLKTTDPNLKTISRNQSNTNINISTKDSDKDMSSSEPIVIKQVISSVGLKGRPQLKGRIIDPLGREYEISYVGTRYKFFNYQTNRFEYRESKRLGGRTYVRTTHIDDNSSSHSSGSTEVTTTKIVDETNECSDRSVAETVVTDNAVSAPIGTKFEYKKPKKIYGQPRVREKYFEPISGRYICPEADCTKSYAKYSTLRGHITQTHSQMNFFCDQHNCGKGFHSQAALNKHMIKHSEVFPFNCDLCDYKTRVKSTLIIHTQRHHSNEKKFKCDSYRCERRFWTAYDLSKHQKEHKAEPTIKCRQKACPGLFHSYSQLNKHVTLVHRQYMHCDWPGCEYKSKSKFLIQAHRRVHTGEKPFVCHWLECGKRFRVNENLKLHMKVHQKRQN